MIYEMITLRIYFILGRNFNDTFVFNNNSSDLIDLFGIQRWFLSWSCYLSICYPLCYLVESREDAGWNLLHAVCVWVCDVNARGVLKAWADS